MLNEQEQKTFSALLDANWNYRVALEDGMYMKAVSESEEVDRLDSLLKELMGETRFNQFYSQGQRLFG